MTVWQISKFGSLDATTPCLASEIFDVYDVHVQVNDFGKLHKNVRRIELFIHVLESIDMTDRSQDEI